MRTGLAVVILAMMVGAVSAQAPQRKYTDEQMQLAGHMGAVIALVRRCGVIEMPNASLMRAMQRAGLSPRDFTDETTAFRRRVTEQASTVAMGNALLQTTGGLTDVQVAARACETVARNYGPSGSIRAGLVPAR